MKKGEAAAPLRRKGDKGLRGTRLIFIVFLLMVFLPHISYPPSVRVCALLCIICSWLGKGGLRFSMLRCDTPLPRTIIWRDRPFSSHGRQNPLRYQPILIVMRFTINTSWFWWPSGGSPMTIKGIINLGGWCYRMNPGPSRYCTVLYGQ